MRAYQVQSQLGVDAIRAIELPNPKAGRGQVIARVRACSLNYRDLGVTHGGYHRNDKLPVIPLSDMAGEIVAVGEGVETWNVGDRVTCNLLRDWLDGTPTDAMLRTGFGGGIDGFLCEQVAVPAHCLLRIPNTFSFEQAATLPCAAVTVWHAFKRAGTKAGQTLLLLGTGGVSIVGLQLGKLLGCRCIITSSSDSKLERAKQLGADETINYTVTPEWQARVRELTDGEGVDQVLEVGGAGTLERSIKATKIGGVISLIGVLARTESQPFIFPTALDVQTIHGIYCGSRTMYRELIDAVAQRGLEPVIDRVFGFDEAIPAYKYFASQAHVGKVVIAMQ